MIKSILSATGLSLMVVSAAWAWPISPATPIDRPTSNLVEAGYKGHNEHQGNNYKHNYTHHNYNNKYRYGNRYWGHRYYQRPYNWQSIGCIAVGPIWYCP
jgi:hypothetical protein